MVEAYHLVMTGTKDKDMSAQAYLKYSIEDTDRVIKDLAGSYQKILDYAEIDKETAQNMQDIMLDFVNLKDRLSTATMPEMLESDLSWNTMTYIRQFLRLIRIKKFLG